MQTRSKQLLHPRNVYLLTIHLVLLVALAIIINLRVEQHSLTDDQLEGVAFGLAVKDCLSYNNAQRTLNCAKITVDAPQIHDQTIGSRSFAYTVLDGEGQKFYGNLIINRFGKVLDR
jgi:hypothetical protein